MTNFARTAAALEAYDASFDTHPDDYVTQDVLAHKVSEAFADDTAAFNDRATVLSCLRPAPPDHYTAKDCVVRRCASDWIAFKANAEAAGGAHG